MSPRTLVALFVGLAAPWLAFTFLSPGPVRWGYGLPPLVALLLLMSLSAFGVRFETERPGDVFALPLLFAALTGAAAVAMSPAGVLAPPPPTAAVTLWRHPAPYVLQFGAQLLALALRRRPA